MKKTKDFWKQLNGLLRVPKTLDVPKLKNNATQTFLNVKDIPEYANKFFATIGEELAIAKDKPNYVKEQYELPNIRDCTQQKN